MSVVKVETAIENNQGWPQWPGPALPKPISGQIEVVGNTNGSPPYNVKIELVDCGNVRNANYRVMIKDSDGRTAVDSIVNGKRNAILHAKAFIESH